MATLEDEATVAARREYDATYRALAACKAGKLDGIEEAFGQAYQALVRAGGAQQIRRKYRKR
jgi:hypothetical protein